MSEGLYQKHRPRRFKDVLGQEAAVKTVLGLLGGDTFPKGVLFTGPSGCGKTTLARILAAKLECTDHDLLELNCATERGIDTVRGISSRLGLKASRGGKCRIWLLDECQMLTGEAQSALLKPLEEAPGHVHFFLCTTHPQKLNETIRTRCAGVSLKLVSYTALKQLVADVAAKEGRTDLPVDVVEKIAECAGGSARRAINLLESVLGLEDEEDMIQTVLKGDQQTAAIDLARKLMDRNTAWGDVAKVLKGLDEDPEGVRRAVLGYAQAILLSDKPTPAVMPRAAQILMIFRYDFFNSGKPGLTAACWELIHMKK